MYNQNPRFDTRNRAYQPFDISDVNRIPILSVRCPNPMQEFLPYVAQCVLNHVFHPINPNECRTYLYNQVGANNFENRDYANLLEMTATIADKILQLDRNAQPLPTIDRVAFDVVGFICRKNFRDDNGLANMTPRDILQAAEADMQDFARMVTDLDNQLNGRGNGYGGAPQQGWSNPRTQSYQANSGWSTQVTNTNSQTHGLYTAAAVPINPKTANRGWSSDANADRSQYAVPNSAVEAAMRLEVVTIQSGSTVLGSLEATLPPTPTPVVEKPKAPIDTRPVENILQQPFNWGSRSNAPAPAPVPSQQIPPEILDASVLDVEENWDNIKPTELLFAFDPNQLRCMIIETEEGIQRAKYAHKPIEDNVDIEQHLATSTIADIEIHHVGTVDNEFAAPELREDNNLEEQQVDDVKVKLEVIHQRKTISAAMYSSDADLIRSVETQRQIREIAYNLDPEKEAHRRPTVAALGYVYQLKAVSDYDVENIIELLTLTNTSKEAVMLLKEAKEVAEKTGKKDTLNLIEFINKRLTKRLNDFILKEMAYQQGNCDSYMDDVQDVETFITEKFGVGAGKILRDNHIKIVKESLYYLTSTFSEAAITDVVSSADQLQLARLKIQLIPFSECKVVLSVSATCKELRFDMPTTKSAVMLRPDETPDFYRVVRDAQDVIDSLPESGDQRMRLIVMTSDGRTFEVNSGIFNPDAFMISVIA